MPLLTFLMTKLKSSGLAATLIAAQSLVGCGDMPTIYYRLPPIPATNVFQSDREFETHVAHGWDDANSNGHAENEELTHKGSYGTNTPLFFICNFREAQDEDVTFRLYYDSQVMLEQQLELARPTRTVSILLEEGLAQEGRYSSQWYSTEESVVYGLD